MNEKILLIIPAYNEEKAIKKTYEKINWENIPSTETPINAENLNKMDSAIDTLDDRVVELSEEVRPIELGGTGATTKKGAEYNIIGGIAETTAALSDGAMAVFRYSTPSATQGVLLYKRVSLFWDYVKSKISSVLGLTATNYGGTAARATADGNGNNIANTYATKAELIQKADEICYEKVIRKYGFAIDGVTDDTQAIQNYINDNAGHVLFFPQGIYRLSGYIKIPSDTTLIGYGATIKFESQIAMVNDADGTIGGYNANKNISVVGFTFIANTTDDCGSVGFGHSENCKISDCTFSGNAGWHMIEINSCNNVEITNCTFRNYGATNPSEMIQLDYAWGSQGFPWFGLYDKTPCMNVKITGCSFYGDTTIEAAAIGNHADSLDSAEPDKIKNVHIENCYFKDLYMALKFVMCSDVSMENCIAENVVGGVYGKSYVKNMRIANNVFIGRGNHTTSADARGIYFQMNDYSVSKDSFHDFDIHNNIIEKFGNHGLAMSGYNHRVSGNIIRNNSRNGVISGYDNRDTVFANNDIRNNNTQTSSTVYPDFKASVYTSKDSVSGGIVIRDNDIGRIGMDNKNPTNASYIFNNIIGSYTAKYEQSNVKIANNFVSGVFEP